MGARHIQNIHRRAAASKQRRLAPDTDEELLLRSLIARFSPTIDWTQSHVLEPTPTDQVTEPADEPANTPTDIPTTPPPPQPQPLPTTRSAAPDVPTAIPPPNTANSPTVSSPTAVVQPQILDTQSIPVQVSQTLQTTPGINVVTTPITSSRPTTSVTVVTRPLTTSASRSIDSSAASSTPSDTGGSGTNVGGIVGGIAGALLGLAVLAFAVQFLIKRHRRKQEDRAVDFNPSDFRHSAVLLPDPPSHRETVERGFNPRPPSMIERKLATPAPIFGAQYSANGGVEYGNMDQYGQYHSYGPGEVMSPPITATSAHPMYSPQDYGQSPFSPVSSPIGSPVVLTRQSSSATQLSRQPSSGVVSEYTHMGAQPPSYHTHAHADHADLDRSSVTPFQAAQYAEISQKLNAQVPAGLDTPAVNEFVQNTNGTNPTVQTGNTNSPFADPVPAALLPGGVNQMQPPRPSSDSVTQELNDFPAPPSPAHSRVDSTPPTLPEIHVESRVASYDFASANGNSPASSGFPSGITKDYMPSPLANQFPVTPSPLASSFAIQSPPPAVTDFPPTISAQPPTAPTTAGVKSTEKRPETVYDDTDAYGGI